MHLTKIPKLYLTKVNEIYAQNKMLWFKKCVQFLDLYVINLNNEEDYELFNSMDFEEFRSDYIYGNNILYFNDFNEILNFVLKFHPSPRLIKRFNF